MKTPSPTSPAPWRYELGIVYDAAGDVVADDVGVRDGALMAAAPTLLEALWAIARRAGPADGVGHARAA